MSPPAKPRRRKAPPEGLVLEHLEDVVARLERVSLRLEAFVEVEDPSPPAPEPPPKEGSR